jgi:hypothetical protein
LNPNFVQTLINGEITLTEDITRKGDRIWMKKN